MTRPVLTPLLALAQTMEGFNTAAFMKDASKAEEAQKTMNVAFQKIDKLTKAKLQDKFLAKIKKQPFWATRQLQRLIRNVKDTVENLQSSGAVVSSTEKPTLLDLPQLPDEPEDAEEDADGDAERAGGCPGWKVDGVFPR
mgnify:CR=1 FL=1